MPVPGITGTSFSIIVLRALALSPIFLIDWEEGPINLMLCCSQIAAKSALSDKKPYPGWMASTPASSATDIIAGMLK